MDRFKIYYTNQKWHFELIPGNKGKQPMAFSVLYNSESECKQAIMSFKQHVIEKQICSYSSNFVGIFQENNRFVYKYFDESGRLLVYSRQLEQKKSAKNAIKRIFEKYIYSEIIV